MIDPRWQKLADVLVYHSVRVQPGERVFIEAFDMPPEFVALLMRTVYAAGGEAIPLIKQTPALRALYQHASEGQIQFLAGLERALMEGVQGYIGLRGAPNYAEMSDIPQEQMQLGAPALVGSCPPRGARAENALGRAALAHPWHGASRQHEHRSVRRILLPRLHAGLRADGA